MKNLKRINCIALTPLETQQINGGTDNLQGSTWLDISYMMGKTLDAFVAFGTEGGKSAGISVR